MHVRGTMGVQPLPLLGIFSVIAFPLGAGIFLGAFSGGTEQSKASCPAEAGAVSTAVWQQGRRRVGQS